jgi:hypothetical protein
MFRLAAVLVMPSSLPALTQTTAPLSIAPGRLAYAGLKVDC